MNPSFTEFPTRYPMHDRPTRAEIDLTALAHNYGIARDLAGSSKLMAMVKAEAYGHGLLPISRVLADLGVDYLGVSFLEEGIALRIAGINVPILVMGGLVDEQIAKYLEYDLEITVSSVWKAEHVEIVAAKHNRKAKVQLKVDTGMGRIGQQWNSVEPFFKTIAGLKHLNVSGIYSHLASADEPDLTFTFQQLERFAATVKSAAGFGIEPELIHIANSSALLRIPDESRFTMARPGLMLYGIPPSLVIPSSLVIPLKNGTQSLRAKRSNLPSVGTRPVSSLLHPVMTLKSQIVFIKKPATGTGIGYGSTYKSPGDSWIATLPVGYGDGYPRRAGNRAFVMIQGRRCPIVGRVSMDMLTVECGQSAYLGDTAVLFGGVDQNALPVWEISALLDTIPYELTTCLTARIPRVYLKPEALKPEACS